MAGKAIIVYGAGSIAPGWGNGNAAAVLYAREGGRVVCVDSNGEAAEDTAATIRKEGGEAHVVAADVTDGATAALATRASLAQFGGVDVVHYNVGMSEPIAAETVSLEAWRSVFAVNLEGALLCAQAALPTMRAQGSGAFVFISTVASLVSAGYAYASYEASKAALNRLCQTLAVAHAAEGIRANVIVPGLIDTPHARHLMAGRAFEPADFMARRAAAPPMKRQGTPWEVAHAAVFLASDAASYITGAVLPVDGGLTLKTASS